MAGFGVLSGISKMKKGGPKLGGVSQGGGFAIHATPDEAQRQGASFLSSFLGASADAAEPNSFKFNTRGDNQFQRGGAGRGILDNFNEMQSRNRSTNRRMQSPLSTTNPFKTGLGT
jgi:hypothetical protein